MEWLKHNAGAAVAILGAILTIVAGYVMYGARISQLEKEREQHSKDLNELRNTVQLHQSDSTRHIDPNRDKKIWEEFKEENIRRFDRIEQKLDRLMIVVPPPTH